MKNIIITYNGFHGRTTRTVRGQITPEKQPGPWCDYAGFRITITRSGSRRLTKAVCGMKDCKCGEGVPESFWVPSDSVNGNMVSILGHYPQT